MDYAEFLPALFELRAGNSAAKLGDWWWSAPDDRVTLSEPAANIFGLDRHEPITWACMRELLAEEHRERARLAVETALATHTDYAIEYRIRRPSGDERWIGAHGRGTYAADGSVLGMIGVVQDVTARKAAEETSQQNAERLRATFEQAAVGISISQLDGRFTDANQKFADILGYERDELWQLKFGDITHPEDAELTRTVVKRLLSGELRDHVFEKRYRRKDGTVIWSLTTVTVIRDAAGKPLHFIGVIEDISRRRQAEDALRDETRVLEVLNRTGATLASQLDIQTLLPSTRAP
ncbi:MAG TPA: PAS domain S-box protein [Polyangiaceae bacterium]